MSRSSASRFLASIVFVVAASLAMAIPAQARGAGATTKLFTPASSASPDSSSHGCQTLYVHLNGDGPATTKCLDTSSASTGVQPDTGTASCGDTLDLFVDAYQSGDEICFSGAGFANLTGYQHCHWVWVPPTTWIWECWSWNDTATSWTSHSQSGAFFSDINGGGIRMNYGANSKGNFTSNPIPNDSLSSICINNGCP